MSIGFRRVASHECHREYNVGTEILRLSYGLSDRENLLQPVYR